MEFLNRKFVVYVLFQLWEAAAFLGAVAFGILVLEETGLADLGTFLTPAWFAILIAMAFLWNRLLSALDLYLSRRLVARTNEYFLLIVAVLLAAGFISLVGAFTATPLNDAVFLSWFMGVCLSLLVPARLVSRLVLRTARVWGRNLRFVAVIGHGHAAQDMATRLVATTNGIRIIGIFGNHIPASSDPAFPRGGSIEDFRAMLNRQPVDEVLISLPMETHYAEIQSLLHHCARVGVSARVMGGLMAGPTSMTPHIETVGTEACLHYDAVPNWGWQGYAKRLMDILGAGIGLILLSPLLLGVAVAIKLDSRGPVFFTQTRVGRNRKHFRFFKFRTMVQDAEARQAALESQNEAGGPVFKIKHDPRITKLGAFLRKYSIDELPQLLNVLIGDMSLVGPRPLPLRDVDRFEHDWYNRRFSVRPGLTCSWVLVGRSTLEFDDWVRADLEYIDNWSLLRDVDICLKTIPAVVRGDGAY